MPLYNIRMIKEKRGQGNVTEKGKRWKRAVTLGMAAVCGFAFAGCVQGKSTLLAKPATAERLSFSERTEEFAGYLTAAQQFAAKFADGVYQKQTAKGETGNLAVSPVSVFTALSLAAECAAGETRAEILAALGVTYARLQTHSSTLYRALNVEHRSSGYFGEDVNTGSLRLTNSIWLDTQATPKQTCIQTLAEKHYCYSYHADFAKDNRAANQALRSFVKEKTNGLIDRDFQLNTETLFALVNTLYLKALWNADGDELPWAEGEYDFQQADGEKTQTRLLQGYYSMGRAYEGDNFTSFYQSANGGYQIHFLVPNEGVSVGEVFTEETLLALDGVDDYRAVDDEAKTRYYTRCLFPEYTAAFDDDVIDVLKETFALNTLFNGSACDFSALTDDLAYCDEVRHVTQLTVDRKGIEGAAVTVMHGAGDSGPDEYKEVYLDFVVNRAFAFVIQDGYGVTLFSGVVNEE